MSKIWICCFREPIFSRISKGCQVLAKQSDELWHRAVVINVKEDLCQVKFEFNSTESEIPLHNILLLGNII